MCKKALVLTGVMMFILLIVAPIIGVLGYFLGSIVIIGLMGYLFDNNSGD